MKRIYLNRSRTLFFATAKACVFFLFGAFASQGVSQSNFRTTNRYELDPPLDGVWVVSEPQNPIRVAFSKLESRDLEVQLDELRRVNKYATLVQPEEKVRVLGWVESKLKELRSGDKKPDQPSTRLFSHALITAIGKLGETAQADLLWGIAQDHSDLALQIEEILIGWKNSLPLETWRSRIADLDGDWQAISLAIQGVDALRDAESIPILTQLLAKPNLPLPIKIASSRVLGGLKTSGLESVARSFYSSRFASKDLIASQLLAEHNSPDALGLQLELVKSDQPAAARIAYASISKFHPQQADQLAPSMLNHKEFTLREQSVVNLDKNPVEANLLHLGSVLRDTHVGLRDNARESLFKHAAAPELRSIVDSIIDERISGENDLAIEQALILAVQLDRKDLCSRFLTLLNHENEIVRIRAAWGLQEIATAEEVIVQVLDVVTRLTEQLKAGKGVSASERLQLAYLLHVFGANNYRPAEPVLREYVPELAQKMTPHARASAIWSLGKILQGSQDVALSAQLQERFFDQGPPDAEMENVRYACAITMARLGALEDPAVLTSAGGTPPYKMGLAVAWVIENHGKLPKP
jgi:hypothetical protein